MFTGLIEATGRVVSLERGGQICRLKLSSSLAQSDLKLGESIAVNGVCLTLTEWDAQSIIADVSPETLKVTTLGRLVPGAKLNLERALRLSDRLGGHIVSGHVDSVGQLRTRTSQGEAQRLEFSLPEGIARYVAPKGSITIDGISLTVNQVEDDLFTVMVIPHTLGMTTLKDMRPGTAVNLESDILARYVERLAGVPVGNGHGAGKLSLEFLAKNGFM
ncbi:MAG: riboflavin synthase [Geopsychrobacter sp.]|nr:riboflavin synthase [Geopsychrobacter sp.]